MIQFGSNRAESTAAVIARTLDLGYEIVDVAEDGDRTVIRFKTPRGYNIGKAIVFGNGSVMVGGHCCEPKPVTTGTYYTPERIVDPAAGTGAFLIDVVCGVNPPYEVQR